MSKGDTARARASGDPVVHMRRLAAIGVALSAEKNVDNILEMIVTEAIDFTNADGGTLYLADDQENVLQFALLRNRSLGTSLGGRAGPINWPPVPLEKDGEPNTANVSACCAINGEIINIPDVYEVEHFDFTGTRDYDRKNGYRSRSMLVVPMKDHEGTITGVLQLINALDEDGNTVVEFTPHQQEIVESLASLAAVALNNARLIRDLQGLFDSLIGAIGTAIDEKSPYTWGHVRRVAELSGEIARAVNATDDGPLADVRFDDIQLREIIMASRLHDLGKVSTPESTLDKAMRLEKITDRSELIELRYEAAKLRARLDTTEAALRKGSGRVGDDARRALEEALREIEEEKEFVLTWNSPAQSPDTDVIAKLETISREKGTITEDELENLSIRRGTLTASEREIVQNHAAVTKKMLLQLRFPKTMSGVPDYAGGHHEMLDGSGYPEGLRGDEIPLQMRVLAVADIFEALTASRPYKAAMSLEKALSVLNAMADEGKLDPAVIEAAVGYGVFQSYAERELT